MKLWDKMNECMDEYKKERKRELMDYMLSLMDSYLKTCASNSKKKAEAFGVYIPIEDFFSNYYFSTWRALEDYCCLSGYSLKNVIIRRLSFAEKDTWKPYKKKTVDSKNEEYYSYESAKWEELGDYEGRTDRFEMGIEVQVEYLDYLNQLKEKDKVCSDFATLMILGYSSSEAAETLNISDNCDSNARKRIQRIKDKARNLLAC